MPALILALYFLTLGTLAGLGFHRIHLLRLLHRHGGGRLPARAASQSVDLPPRDVRTCSPTPGSASARERDPLPYVTVQLPIYNEASVAPRLIEAVCRLDWPKDRIEIQVPDDSTDDTHALVEALASRLRAEGNTIRVLHRDRRDGY